VAEVVVVPLGGGTFRVRVTAEETTTHDVTIPPDLVTDLGLQGVAPDAVVRESFGFLLEREPNTSILPAFSLDEIARYFPEYPEDLPRRLGP
jgi:hypothetical protein